MLHAAQHTPTPLSLPSFFNHYPQLVVNQRIFKLASKSLAIGVVSSRNSNEIHSHFSFEFSEIKNYLQNLQQVRNMASLLSKKVDNYDHDYTQEIHMRKTKNSSTIQK